MLDTTRPSHGVEVVSAWAVASHAIMQEIAAPSTSDLREKMSMSWRAGQVPRHAARDLERKNAAVRCSMFRRGADVVKLAFRPGAGRRVRAKVFFAA